MLARRKLEAALIARSEAALFDMEALEHMEEDRQDQLKQSYLYMAQQASDEEDTDDE